ncbi:3-methyl-2-oxobutanoate dehydrogenase subunit VorB [Methanothermobacter thermautotrophicus]|jgi:2-oxoisovalerate ferredoxin oxidoreductase alpha subunit|uniref:Ketoisovalerate oxidoreductase subunit VorB n=2 Tax=Methanothermobacter thermautotrophicus TaxID=145262 RepID=VORB_METTH|nr:3-methyl-2-oxobutanoate dehydrogenase subunit VorB [Methanothermobacter thermautotrophicus]O26800.3 RecName: Full=Ketoisovalerate oxidoreductase subunit VorB; Short=VOR; AltName: Full=2-oxoisovalerate ferredoxin reductase subunit beta; AltName: Full=2-oxoisovalerate oxidoreductase beta chain [Methanothermobacter thermautotrophicus str. Delta H]WBF06941.1 3-methyl-2-oxobutanoate dehydrogenase subunit VorB [Methanothermobacter thermautotrophicus]HIH64574.1 3-methyl-2-oxobutanoate dehydrogenase 
MATQMVKGNTAVIIGAMYAGCDCYFGYPITPASEILHEASRYFPMVGRKFVQAESEEAAINMVYGAAAAGHRVMTASSGPGISLKQEGISFLAGAELPAVIVDVMRAGPGLGNIGPEQGDYNQIVKGGGHGNYRNMVLAPSSVQEMCDLTMEAFELADKYRNPVVVLTDAVLGQMAEPLRFPEEAVEHRPDTSWAVCGNRETMKNLVTSIFLDFDELEEFNFYLQEKYARIEENEVRYEEYLVDDAEIVMVAYGISSRVARSAVETARAEGINVGLLRPITLFPFPSDRIRELADGGCRFISVEMSSGQMREDIRMASGCRDVELVNRMGGNLIELRDVLEKIREVAGDSSD